MEKVCGTIVISCVHGPSTSASFSTRPGRCGVGTANRLCSLTCGVPRRDARMEILPRRNVVVMNSTLEDVDTTPSASYDNQIVALMKLKLLSIVAGLNRGLAASKEDMDIADAAAKEVETAGGPVDLACDLDKLQGKWRLVYSSAFSSRTVGGSRPGPPLGRLLPITLGQVFQRIDVVNKDFDNIVEIELGAPWPLPPVQVTATLAHKFEVKDSATVNIKFEKTAVKTSGVLSQLPLIEIPRIPDSFRPPSNPGSGDFEVTYADSDMRITRGDRGELRVFVVA